MRTGTPPAATPERQTSQSLVQWLILVYILLFSVMHISACGKRSNNKMKQYHPWISMIRSLFTTCVYISSLLYTLVVAPANSSSSWDWFTTREGRSLQNFSRWQLNTLQKQGGREWERDLGEDVQQSNGLAHLCISLMYLGTLRRRLLLSRITRIRWAKSWSSAI